MAEEKKWWNQQLTGKHVPWVFVAAAVLWGVVLLIPQSPDTDSQPSTNSEQASLVSVRDYTIVTTEDLSFGATTRYQYRVVVPGDTTEEELRAVVDDIVETAKDGPAFNAISVGLFASESEVDGAYTLGYAEYAPGGQWDAADTVSAGDYDAMTLKVDIY